jgi:flagellar assembly protein FliH
MSTVIKAGQVGPILRHLSTVDLADHLAEADAAMDQAKRRVARTMVDAEQEARRLREEAQRQGHDAGYEQGHAEGVQAGYQAAHDEAMESFRQEHAQIVAAMQEAVTSIDAVKEDLAIAARRDLLDLALLIAKKLTFAIGDTCRESASENLGRALRLVGSQTDLLIRVHPKDLASMEKFAESALAHIRAAHTVKIVADESMAPGGCKVENERTSIDASLETQVSEIVSLLLGGRLDNDHAVC